MSSRVGGQHRTKANFRAVGLTVCQDSTQQHIFPKSLQ